MKVQVILNGKVEERDIPISWDQVPYNTFVKLTTVEPLDILSILWGIDKEVLKRSKIVNFEQVSGLLGFMKVPIDTTNLPKQILGSDVPKDLNFDEVGRYWDIKMIYDSFFENEEKKYKPDLSKFPEIVATAVMPGYLDAKKEDQEAFAKEMSHAPCGEVLAIANFYLARLTLLNLRTGQSSSPTSTRRKSWRLATINWLRNLGITVRLWLWRRKLRSQGMKF